MTMLEKTFEPQAAEPRLYAQWEKSGLFAPRTDGAAEAYSIVIPPPNVTGSLRMADVQAACHVRRRNDDRIGLGGAVGAGREQAALFPLGVKAGLGGLGFESLLKHRNRSFAKCERAAPFRSRPSD